MTRKRSVCFDHKSNALVPVKRASRSESSSLWYSSKELKRIRLDLRCALKNLALSRISPTNSDSDDDHDDDGESFQWRGLEHIQNGTMCSSRESRQCLVQGVLSMQKMHKTMGLQDDKGLHLFTRAYTKDATQRAQDLAIQDFDEALQIYNEGKVDAKPKGSTLFPDCKV